MSQIDGKQITDSSVSLDKLEGMSGVVTFIPSATMSFSSGAVLRQSDENILVGTDVVNKNYVDAVAQGLNVKESVHVISDSPITLSGTQSIDNYLVSIGERVLVNSQGSSASNGIYIVSSGSWSRSADADGLNILSEVRLGDFVFVAFGDVYAGTGWVLNLSDSADYNILVGTESQRWSQFSSAGVIVAGDGLGQIGNNFFVNSGVGLTVSLDILQIANTGVTAGTYGDANSVPIFTVNSQGQLAYGDQIDIIIPSTQVSDFALATETSIFTDANFVDGSTIQFDVTVGDSTTAEVVLNSLTASRLNIINSGSASQGWKLGYNTNGQFEWFDPTQNNISQIVAGNGLSGGGLSGSVTLDVNTSNGLTIISDSVQIDETAAGNGLTFSSGVFSVNTSNGITINGDNVEVSHTIAGTGLTFSGGVLNVTGSSQPVYDEYVAINTTGDFAVVTGAFLTLTPNDYSRVEVFVNGQRQRLGDGVKTKDCYFSSDGGVTAKSIYNLVSSDVLYWNGTISGFNLSTTDKIEIVYQA